MFLIRLSDTTETQATHGCMEIEMNLRTNQVPIVMMLVAVAAIVLVVSVGVNSYKKSQEDISTSDLLLQLPPGSKILESKRSGPTRWWALIELEVDRTPKRFFVYRKESNNANADGLFSMVEVETDSR